MIIVADSSPILSLSIIGKLDLLNKIFDNFIIPQAVYSELIVPNKPHSDILRSCLKNNVKTIANKVAVDILNIEIGLGESEAIILAIENNINTILVDDYKARIVAEYKQLDVIGTIGLLLKAKRCGFIDRVKPLLDKLIENNIRISNELYMTALLKASE